MQGSANSPYNYEDRGFNSSFKARHLGTHPRPEHAAAAAAKMATDALFTLFDNAPSQYESLQTICCLLKDCDEETAIEVTNVLAAHVLPQFGDPLGDPDLQALLLRVLTLASICESSTASIRDGGGIQLTVRALEAHRSSALVQEEGCWTLFKLAGGAIPWRRHQNAVTDQGGLPAVLAAMAAHGECAAVQAAAIAGLGSLVQSHPANQATAVESGAIVSVALATGRHIAHEALLSYGSAFFLKIATGWPNTAAQDCAAILQSGGLEGVLAGMAAHPDHAGIQIHGCKLVAAMASLGGDELSVELVKLGAASAVLAAMRAHSGCAHLGKVRQDRVVTAEGIKALAALATTRAVLQSLKKEGTFFQVEVAQKTFCEDPDPMVQDIIQGVGFKLMIAVHEGVPMLR